MLTEIWRRFLPDKVLAMPDENVPEIDSLTQGKTSLGGKPTVYICQNFACSSPITRPRLAQERSGCLTRQRERPDLKAILLTDPERPKAKEEDVLPMLQEAGIGLASRGPDFGIVVGGDGIFSHYGRLISFPLLFVSVRSRDSTASKGYLADVNLDDLPHAPG